MDFSPTTAASAQLTEAVLFDLDGTLRHSRPSSVDTFMTQAAQIGAPSSAEARLAMQRWTHHYWAQSQELLDDLAVFPGREEEFWAHYALRSLVALGCDDELAQRLAPEMHRLMSTYNPESWVPPEVHETLALLKTRGLRLGLLSNRTHPVQDELAELGLLDYFDMVMVAADVSVWKPDPLIFQHALERMQVSAGRSVYVGDNYYADIVGAQRAGMRPVLLDPLGIFPEAECTIIHQISEVPGLILV